MKFEKKTAAEIAAMSAEDQEKYIAAKEAHDTSVRKQEIEDALKPLKDEQKNLLKDIKDVAGTANSIEETMKTFNGGPSESVFMKALKDNADAIKESFSKGGVVELTFKAEDVSTHLITTGVATGGNNAPANYGAQITPPSNVNFRRPSVLDKLSKLTTSTATYAYTQTVPKNGDYGFVAEGGEKPPIDFTIETKYANPVKIAAHMHLTEESVQDIPALESIARDFLRKKHDLKFENGVLFGTGASNEPKGATEYGRTFVAGSMAAKVVKPNIMDVINAAVTDIYTTHNYQDETPYEANTVLINPIDFFLEFVSAKDERGLPLYPTASLFNQVTIGGITIMPHPSIPAGKIFVADLSKYNITEWLPYVVKIGWINDDFIKNQFAIVGESRFHAFVKKLDEQAFIYDDIATIKTAITKPVTP